jgi:hypothetical protein
MSKNTITILSLFVVFLRKHTLLSNTKYGTTASFRVLTNSLLTDRVIAPRYRNISYWICFQ